MQACIKREAMGDDPPYLAVGTEVSAKYKGAFCEAKVRKVVRSVKCKVTFKLGLGTAIVTDDQIRGTLRSGSSVEAKHPEKKDFVEASITKIQDCSQYTVVFDDGDITTLRRSALCLKSGRHFAESETLDQLPLTHPEHFSNPVIGGSRRGRRSRQTHDDGSEDEEDSTARKGKKKEEKEVDIGKVVCVELGERKKQKDNWFPGLVVAPTAQDTVRIRVKDEYLVRSFKDGRYFTVPKKEATEFTREIGAKVDNNTLKAAVEKALQFLDRDELPPHWDRELLFRMDGSSGDSNSEAGSDSDSSDDEPREEKDHFVAQLYKFMDDRGTPINKGPTIGMKDVDLYKLFKVVHKIGGYNRVTNHNQWKMVSQKLGFGQNNTSNTNLVKQAYKKFLHSFEDFYRKLGCTMVNHPRGSRSRHRSSRSLIRDRDRATPINTPKRKEADDKEKSGAAASSKKTEIKSEEAKPEEKEDTVVAKVEEEKKESGKTSTSTEKKELEKKATEEKGKTGGSEEKGKGAGTSSEEKGKGSGASEETKAKPMAEKKGKQREQEKAAVTVAVVEEVEKVVSVRGKWKDDTPGKGRETGAKGRAKEDAGTKSRISKAEEKTPKEDSKAKAKEEAEKKVVAEEPSPPVKVEPSESTGSKAGTPSTPSSSLKTESVKTEPVEPSTPVAEVRKGGRELGLRSQVKEVASLEIAPKDVKQAEKDKSRGVVDDAEDNEEEELKVDDDEGEEEDGDDEGEEESVGKKEGCGDAESRREERRREKRGDDEEKLTRSKSKESNPEGRRARESRTPIRESEMKKGPSKPGSVLGVVGSSSTKRPVSSSSSSASSGSGGSTEEERKRGRKRKDLEEKGSKAEEHMGQLSNHIHVGVGDKLKVYYGPTHESKVTYEAKVVDTEMDGHQTLYLVHYTGWNTRYDEWIKRSRIAENLSWNPTRAKRLRQQQQSQSMKPMGKRGRPSLSGGSSRTSVDSSGNGGGPPGSQHYQPMGAQTRSATPSGSSSQSPSVRGAGSMSGASPHPTTPTSSGNSFRGVTTRGNAGLNTSTEFSPVSSGNFSLEMRRRSRRMSGHTDVSMPSESESEEYESEPEPEVEPLRTRSRGERKTSITIMPSKAEEAVIAAVVDEKPSTKETKGGDRYLRKRGKRKKEKAEEEEEERKEAALEEGPEGVEGPSGTPHSFEGQEPERTSEVAAVEEPPPSSEKKRVKRTTRRSARDDSEKQEVSLPPETSQLEMEEDTPKGRDFDLNQIRSELKGIEKAVKLPIDLPPMQSDSGEAIDVTMENTAQEEMDSKESDVKEPPTLVSEASAPVVEEVTEDIYEFKEPEPFEFEVRSKRDTLIIEERGMKLGRRCNSRLMRREVKTSPSKVSEGSKESLGWTDSLPSFRATSSRRAATAAAKKSEESPSNEETAAKSLSPVRPETKPDAESPHVTPSKASSSSPSQTEHSSTKMHHSSTPTGTEEDEAHSPLSTKHTSLPEEDESSKKPVPSSTGSAAKSRSSPFGLMSSSIPMFSPRKSPSLSSPSAISPPSMHSIDLEPLCLFGDLPSSADGDVGEDDDGGDESGDRLIISDKPGDAEPPLFTYPQRHEELFPASLVSSGGVGSSCDDAEDSRKQSDDEPPCLIPMPIFDLPSKSSAEKGDKDNKSTAIERSEVVKVVVQEEEDGVETEAIVKKPQALKCSDSFSTDMINLLLKDDEEEEGEGEGDESISAAIQRVISSEIMDEDDDDEENLTLFGKKPTKEFFRRGGKDKECPPPMEKIEEGAAKMVQFTVAVEEECAQEEKQEKMEVVEEVRKSPELRDQVVSQGHSTPLRDESMSVVMRDDDSSTDTDSDSSEESRLVIDKLDEGGDDDESMQSSYNESERKPKEETVVIVDSAKVDCVKQCSLKMFGVKESPKAEEEAAKEVECDEPHPSPIISSPKKEVEEGVPKDKSEDVMLKVAVKEESADWKESESDKEGECKVQTEMQIKAEEEAESSLRSLLCEETIPGSPVPAANDSRECCQDIPEKQSKVPEMPFASVPGNENSSSSSLLRSESVRNDGNICGGLSSSAQLLKGSLEPFACESNITTNPPPCRPSAAPCAAAAAADDEPSAPGSESTSTTAPKGKDAGGNDAAPVMDNTPPTTPESSLSTISGSPREERGGSSPGLDNDSSKSHRESSEIDLDSPVEGNKVDHFSEDLSVSDSLLNIDVSISEDNNQLMLLQGLKVSGPQKRSGVQDLEKDTPSHAAGSAGMQDSPSKKKRRTHRRSEDPMSQGAKRLRHSSGRGRNLGGSDSDDTSENSTSGGCTPLTSTENVVSSRSPRPSKYNFYVELDPELDGTQRIALLQQKLQELRKTYMSVKAELACIDRRRKKLRRREREEKAAKHEVACS
ncbi:microtubule-associated protein futsch-like [Hetaerina americana]|uniref:microtubule-associated protein futsch-like n=1 Tax=Hetaerina americana TaxID=62018 RepID=UPI003A7F3FF9